MTGRVAYVSGPITGRPLGNAPAFAAAQAQLEQQGLAVINPAALGLEGRPWAWCMVVCLWHLRLADEVRLLPGWEHSAGARLEVAWAVLLGLRIYPALGHGPCVCP